MISYITKPSLLFDQTNLLSETLSIEVKNKNLSYLSSIQISFNNLESVKALNTAQCKITIILIIQHAMELCNIQRLITINIIVKQTYLVLDTHMCLYMCTRIVKIQCVRALFSYALLHLLFISLQITLHWTIVWKISLITLTANLILLKHTYPSECHMLFSMILCVNQDNMFSDH